jgi:hypothetical protein
MSMLTTPELRTRVGLNVSDASRDDSLVTCYTVSLEIVEAYLDRWLILKERTEYFHCKRRSISLRAYPVTSIKNLEQISGKCVDANRGLIHHACVHDFSLVYSGGYMPDAMPPVIALVINSVFDAVWQLTPGFGIESAEPSDNIKAFTINGVRLEYANGGSNLNQASATGFISPAMRDLLLFYRREYC